MMFVKATQESLDDVRESFGILLGVPEYSRMILDDSVFMFVLSDFQ